MSSMNFTCDVCGREVFSCTFVNGMKFCAKCYQETFGETDKDRKIADLEAKLEESEKSKESYRLQNEQHHLQLLQFYSRLGVEAFGADIHEKALEALMIMKDQLAESENQCRECKHLNKKIELNIKNKLMAENCELQKQLAENEKEISEYIKIVDDLHKQLSDKCDFCDKTKDQDKISFALEQIQELKKFTEKEIKECNKLLQEELEDDYYIQSVGARQSMCYEFKREIDNQIKQLNEGK